ncbi:hypothetical protein T484DRAFT_1802521, partial [Baffinella frigidus]
ADQAVTFTVVLTAGAALFSPGGAPVLHANGTLEFRLAPDALGVAGVEVVMRDSGGGGTDTSASHNATITAVGSYLVMNVAVGASLLGGCPTLAAVSAVAGTIAYDTGYGVNQACAWVLAPAGAEYVSLTVTFMDTEQGYDLITLFECDDGACAPSARRQLAQVSGSGSAATVTSTTGIMRVQFASDNSNVGTGFRASFSSVPSEQMEARRITAAILGSTTPLVRFITAPGLSVINQGDLRGPDFEVKQTLVSSLLDRYVESSSPMVPVDAGFAAGTLVSLVALGVTLEETLAHNALVDQVRTALAAAFPFTLTVTATPRKRNPTREPSFTFSDASLTLLEYDGGNAEELGDEQAQGGGLVIVPGAGANGTVLETELVNATLVHGAIIDIVAPMDVRVDATGNEMLSFDLEVKRFRRFEDVTGADGTDGGLFSGVASMAASCAPVCDTARLSLGLLPVYFNGEVDFLVRMRGTNVSHLLTVIVQPVNQAPRFEILPGLEVPEGAQ